MAVTVCDFLSKVGDTLTATASAAVTKYEWSLNGTVQATTETFEVPASAKSGDRIKVTVTAEDGETAEDTVYVGGFTILLVEPTTDADANGYKYLRAEFSSALAGLEPEDIEIRAKKNNQLYSVESVKLSSDGTSADITLFGSVLEGGTKFLQPATIYTMAITNNGITDTYEFELPANYADELVTGVDIEKATITVKSTYDVDTRAQAGQKNGTFKIGDVYDGNLGELVGRTVNIGLNSDNEVETFSVNDAEVVYAAVKAVKGDTTAAMDSTKDYLQAADKTKYYWSVKANESSSVTRTYAYDFKNDPIAGINDDTKFDYAKLVLNPDGTISYAMLGDWEGLIVATSAEDGVATESKNNTKDFSSDFTIVEGGAYIDADDLEDGDVIYYNDTMDFAEVYRNDVTGTLDAVYTDSATVDGTNYKWASGEPYAKVARRWDDGSEKYVDVTEKWLLSADTTEDVTFTLDRNNQAVLVEAVQGEVVTTTHDYIITKTPVAYLNGVDQMMNIGVSDGTATTLKIALSDLKYVEGSKKTTWKAVATGTETEITAKTTAAGFDLLSSEGATPAATYAVDTLLTVTCNEDGDVIGLKTNTEADKMDNTGSTTAALKPGLTQLKTQNGKYALSDDTNIYIITGKKGDNSDMAVTKVAYGDYNKVTKTGDSNLATAGAAVYAGDCVLVYATNTQATSIVIDASAKEGASTVAQNAIFSQNDVAETVVGVVKATKTGLNSDQDATELKEITILNGDYPKGITYDELPAGKAASKTDIVSIDLDEDGNVLDVQVVGLGATVGDYKTGTRYAIDSTETVEVGTDTIRPTATAYVAFYDGKDFTATTIGALNREATKYGTLTYYVSEKNGTDVASEIIIASDATTAPLATLASVTVNQTTAWTLPSTTTATAFTVPVVIKNNLGTTLTTGTDFTIGNAVVIEDLVASAGGNTTTYTIDPTISITKLTDSAFATKLTDSAPAATTTEVDHAGTVLVPVTYNGMDYGIVMTIDNEGVVSAKIISDDETTDLQAVAAIAATGLTVQNVAGTPDTTCTLAITPGTGITTAFTATSSDQTVATVTTSATAGVITATYAGAGNSDITLTYTGDYYKKTWVYTIHGDGVASKFDSCVAKKDATISAL